MSSNSRRFARWSIVVLGAVLCFPGMAPTQEPASEGPTWTEGQICWAYYEPHSAWYAAHVVSSGADGILVQHFDGFEETVPPERIMGDHVAVGDSLSAYFKQHDGDTWFNAVVVERRGMDIVVEYSDGEQETTWLRWIRMPAPPPGEG